MSKPSLAETHPEIAKEWHPTKNKIMGRYGIISPDVVVYGSGKKIWWKCDNGDDHIFLNSIRNRTKRNQGCPYCNKKRVSKEFNLTTSHPNISRKWDYKKNEALPENYHAESVVKVWWKCDKYDTHPSWEKVIRHAIKTNECKTCNSFGFNYPNFLKLWDKEKNIGINPFKISKKNGAIIWWKCDKFSDHSYEMRVSSKTTGLGCPQCTGHQLSSANNLEVKHPEILDYWDFEKNVGIKPSDFFPNSPDEVWWKCDKERDHKWKQKISNVVKNVEKCSICNARTLVESVKLKNKFPKIYNQIFFQKHTKDFVENLRFNDSRKAWWKCSMGDDHIWDASVYHRTKNNSGCPICENLKVVKSNALSTTDPKISNEWHPTMNGNLKSSDITRWSNKKIWFKCPKGDDHEWKTFLYHRTVNKSNCPFCDLTPQSKQELIITFELKKIFNNIDPKGFKTRLDGRLRAIDIFIPLLKLAIEFDGSYWHKDKLALDKIKSENLMDEGYKVIRIREHPLKKIHENDIVSIKPYNGKQITDNILKRILELYDLDSKARNKIEVYLKKDSLQNEKGLDRYIDQILTEKAEKREQLH